jgi:FkbM family methyltransferase
MLPSKWRFKFLLLLSDMHHIETVVVRGDYGKIEGSLHDFGIFTHYIGYRTWSPEIVELFSSRMTNRTAGTYLDIGANIGLTTIPLAQRSTWDFHVFEPDPTNVQLLRLNLLRNALSDRVTVHNLALSKADSTLTLKRSPDNFGDFRLAADGAFSSSDDKNWPTVEVAAKRLDDVLSAKELRSPIIIKIDTQGAEPLVVAGGKDIFSHADFVVMEFWPHGILRLGNDPQQFLGELQKLFANVHALNPLTGEVMARSFEEISQITKRLLSEASLVQLDLVLSRSDGSA